METSALNRIALRVVFALSLLAAPVVHASLLTFDDLEFSGTSSAGLPASQNYGGFAWDSKWSVGNTNKSGFTAAAQSGTQFLFNEGATRHLTVGRDTPFDFLGAWFVPPSASQMPTSFVRVTAYDAHNTLLGTSRYINITGGAWIDGSSFGNTFVGISRLVIDPFGGVFAMDNFSYRLPETVVTVNEAGSFVLLLIGFFCLWLVRRRGRTD
ncbi:hypothetical protein [Marinimicrobium sp. ABcell2]|uniref:hypothetical protein n=1 Tax=Marinimicrobium sp. ABcell2 TaxID=3069751 RepID=UPI0027AEF5B7|nr:hypothetical protein [Marinimicrobium sp. ABcell2]MDQ2075193.1 hypothetical protein [Marinimicrobium sp. ABcell2]